MIKIGSNGDKIEIEIQNSTYLFSSLKFGLMEYSLGTVKGSLSFIPLSSGFFQFGCCLSNNVLKKQKKKLVKKKVMRLSFQAIVEKLLNSFHFEVH